MEAGTKGAWALNVPCLKLAEPLALLVTSLRSALKQGPRDRVGEKIHMYLPEFKRWLIDQHRQGRLVLARADFIAAMPHDLVMHSEAKTEGAYSGSTFHFVVDPSV